VLQVTILCLAALSLSTALVCPDGGMCAEKDTCCKNTEGGYGCCPLPNAECCSDHLHCCYEGTICDLVHRKCAVICPDMVSECPDGTTCCELPDSSWGCCPLEKAVCCSDKMHCCPEGTNCDLVHSKCISSTSEPVPMFKKAVCCDDNIHCCPSGTQCDSVHSTCLSSTTNTSMVNKIPALDNVPCNGSVACEDGNTCCKMLTGSWACCPLAEAVCCEDHLHCCPHGTVCNLKASTCDSMTGSLVMPLVSKDPVEGSDDIECDKVSSCPDGHTCCKTSTGEWACCPLPEAVCCDDHIHCCPHGTVCNLAAQTCDDPFRVRPPVSWVEKVPALTSEAENEKCDKQTMCPGGTTCCKKTSGQWACCPLPQAVCCNDHEHCCPKGYKCNVAEQTCDKPGEVSLPWVQKTPALLKETLQTLAVPAPSSTMCDHHTSCPRDTTCCFMKNTHKWGCCPAICCDDGDHCCPRGHTCEPHRSSCSKGPHVIPWLTKLGAFNESNSVTDVKCDDKSSCASGTTCCKLPTGDWGCCPLVKQAVCCEDHEHCCPQSYTCNMQTGTCEKAVCCPDLKHCCPAGFSCDPTTGECTQTNLLTWDPLLQNRRRDFRRPGL
uniref:Granulins domain-containing protein n=1 Tax=Periophthalmus magnuspinnatus TaxID=409849 RepID=A0A3B4APR3_9GOBI